MSTPIQLTPTQNDILKVAAYRPDGNIEPLSPALRGGARTRVIEGLLARRLIAASGNDSPARYVLTEAGYTAVGRKCPAPASQDAPEAAAAALAADPELEANVAAREAEWAQEKQDSAQQLLKVVVEGKPRTRANSKQAQVIEMLRRPEGATISQICESTGWLSHTTRGFFAGCCKKKLGLNLTSAKTEGEERIYRLCD